MKAKTIRAICRAKHKAWVKSIDNEVIKKLAQENTVITGGAIASMLLNEEVNDFDLYFRDKKTCEAIANYYVGKFKAKDHDIRVVDDHDRIKIVVKSAGIASESERSGTYKYFEGDPDPDGLAATEYVEEAASITKDKSGVEKGSFTPVFLSSNAITLSDKMQLIIRFYGEPNEIHGNFDFVHCTNYWMSWEDTLILRKEALEALLAKDLKYVGSKYPICSIIRTRKFLDRGWRINAGQYLKMAFQVSELNLHDVKVLEEQLVGVDVAYFNQLINCLKDADPNHVDTTYLMELVDDIF